VNAAWALLLLCVEEAVAEAVAEAEAEAVAEAAAAAAAHCLEAGEREVSDLHAARGGGLFLEPRGCPTGLFPASPLAFASSSCSSLSCLSLCSFSQSRC